MLVDYLKKQLIPDIHTSDICEHLITLFQLGLDCESITEFGFRTGTSFTPFLLSNPKKLISYDIRIPGNSEEHFKWLADKSGITTKLRIVEADTRRLQIEETDMLFIDTLHTYDQLKIELDMHGKKAKKYLVFHDTETFGEQGEDGNKPGLRKAITEFLSSNSSWDIDKIYRNNNGLTILKNNKGNKVEAERF